jgi:hypothetical protein
LQTLLISLFSFRGLVWYIRLWRAKP